MKRNLVLCMIVALLLIIATKSWAQVVRVRILDSTYIPTIREERVESNQIVLSCDDQKFNQLLKTFAFKHFEQSYPRFEEDPWLLDFYTFYFMSYEERDRFLEVITLFHDIFKDVETQEPNYKIAATVTSLFNDTHRDRQNYLDYINFPETYSIIQNNSNRQDTVVVGIVDLEHFDPTHEDYIISTIQDPINNNNAIKSHGTQVLGTLGAINNNACGIISTGGDVSKFVVSADIFKKAFLCVETLVRDYKCKVINCSWTGETNSVSIERAYRTFCDSLDCVVVCSAGNGLYDTTYINNTDKQYPASFESCLSVSSVNHRNDRHSGIGYHCFDTRNPDSTFQHNDAVDICAPGKYIYTTDTNNTYTYSLGTSFSAPIVAGIAAMIRYINPCLTARQVVDVLKTTANDTIYKIAENAPYKGLLGAGLVDAGAAVQKAVDLREPHLYIRDSKKDYGVEPYLGSDYTHSPDIVLKNIEGVVLPDNKSWDEDNYLLDVTIRKIGCEGFRISDSTQLIATIGATSLFTRFCDVHSDLFSRIFESTNTPFLSSNPSQEIVDSIVIQNITFQGPEILWGIPMEDTFSSSNANAIPLEHIKLGFNLMAVVDENGEGDAHLHNHPSNDGIYVKANRTAAMNKGNEIISQQHFVRLAELYLAEMPASLVVRQKHQIDSTILSDNAEVYLWLSDNLIDYLEYPSRLNFVDENRILLTNTNTEISLITPVEGEYFIGLEVHFFGDEEPQHSIYDVDIELVEEDEVSDVLTFTAIRDESVYFSAVASTSSNEIMNTQAATLSSNTISEEASYTWFDAAMDTIGSGRQLTVQPDKSQTYTLKIQQSNNGYVASDTVSVRVLDGRITTITPNPATSLTVIAYELSENKSANITITDVSNTIRQTYPLNQSNGTLTISVDNMPKGVYYVTLNVDGAVADTKSLIIR